MKRTALLLALCYVFAATGAAGARTPGHGPLFHFDAKAHSAAVKPAAFPRTLAGHPSGLVPLTGITPSARSARLILVGGPHRGTTMAIDGSSIRRKP